MQARFEWPLRFHRLPDKLQINGSNFEQPTMINGPRNSPFLPKMPQRLWCTWPSPCGEGFKLTIGWLWSTDTSGLCCSPPPKTALNDEKLMLGSYSSGVIQQGAPHHWAVIAKKWKRPRASDTQHTLWAQMCWQTDLSSIPDQVITITVTKLMIQLSIHMIQEWFFWPGLEKCAQTIIHCLLLHHLPDRREVVHQWERVVDGELQSASDQGSCGAKSKTQSHVLKLRNLSDSRCC